MLETQSFTPNGHNKRTRQQKKGFHNGRGAGRDPAVGDKLHARGGLRLDPQPAPSQDWDADRGPICGLSSAQMRTMVEAYMCHAPMALTLRELNRLFAIETLPACSNAKVLDVGCGDGFWWTLRERRGSAIHGVDINAQLVALAAKHIRADVCDVAKDVPFAGQKFDEIIGNCSLEHVLDLEGALRNLRRAAAPGARLVLFVPSQLWAYQGYVQRTLLKRAPRLGMAMGGLMNGFFQHWHVYDVAQWKRLLAASGWKVTRADGLGNPRSEMVFRLLLPQAFASFLFMSAVGRYPSKAFSLLPKSLLKRPVDLLSWALQDPLVEADAPSAYEYMLVAQAN